MHTTNYVNTFIQVADDCPAATAEVPPRRGESPTIAAIQYDLIANNPYTFTSDEVIFGTFARRRALPDQELGAARRAFFSKGQACLRSSPLAKRYGFGIHHDADGKIALYPRDSPEYDALAHDEALNQLKAMRLKRADRPT